MTLIERHLLKRLGGTFLAALGALAGVVWVTRALKDLNVITAKGQTLLIFMEITALAMPFLLVVIAPFAMLVASVFVLNSMSASSELVVVAAAGGSRMRVLKPLFAVALTVSCCVFGMTSYAVPTIQRALKELMTSVNADLVANIIQPGRFTNIDDGLTFHIRSKAGDGTLIGLVIDDRRDDSETKTYLAEEAVVIEAGTTTVLVMKNGTLLRKNPGKDIVSSVKFDTYGFDMSDLAPKGGATNAKPSERTTYALLWPDPSEEFVTRNNGRFRAELHDRLSQPLLSLSFAMIAFLFLGDVRTTRQGRGLAATGAVLSAILLRGAHFAAISASVNSAGAVAAYAVPISVVLLGVVLIAADRRLALPAPIERLAEAAGMATGRFFGALTRRCSRRPNWGTP